MTQKERFIVTGYTKVMMLKPNEWSEFYKFIDDTIGWKVKSVYDMANNNLWDQLHSVLEDDFKKLIYLSPDK